MNYRNMHTFLLSLLAFLILNVTTVLAQETERDCGQGERLLPFYQSSHWFPNKEYPPNAEPFDAICMPETWAFMQHRWQALTSGIGNWPYAVIIDDGFFHFGDSGIRPDLHIGFPDGSLNYPHGTALGGTSIFGVPYGHHGTRVLSLMASEGNNQKMMVGVAAPWDNISNGSKWGPRYVPVRIGKGGGFGNELDYLVQAFDEVVFQFHEARVVNLSQDLVAVPASKVTEIESRLKQAKWRQTVVVTGGGNDQRKVAANHWLKDHGNVIIVGALDRAGQDLWIDGADGTATGDGIDLYAPGADIAVIDPSAGLINDSGTSYAAPMVTGVVAMMQNLDPTLDAPAIRSILIESGDKISPPSGTGSVRRLNAFRAVTCAETVTVSMYAPGYYQWWCSPGVGGTLYGTYSIF